MAKDDPERAARLAEALRANLRRRKAQAREVGVNPATDSVIPAKAGIHSAFGDDGFPPSRE